MLAILRWINFGAISQLAVGAAADVSERFPKLMSKTSEKAENFSGDDAMCEWRDRLKIKTILLMSLVVSKENKQEFIKNLQHRLASIDTLLLLS